MAVIGNAEMNQAHVLKKIDDRLMSAILQAGENIDPMTPFSKLTGKLRM